MPRPASDGEVLFEFPGPSVAGEDGETRRPRIEGDLYLDGSCSTGRPAGLNRAGWGIIALDAASNTVTATICGLVWSSLPQTPQSAEFCAYGACRQLLEGDGVLHIDCTGVVGLVSKTLEQQLQGNHKYTGIAKQAMAFSGENDRLQEG